MAMKNKLKTFFTILPFTIVLGCTRVDTSSFDDPNFAQYPDYKNYTGYTVVYGPNTADSGFGTYRGYGGWTSSYYAPGYRDGGFWPRSFYGIAGVGNYAGRATEKESGARSR